jgi:nucleoside-diphosphate-sugar epimerase
MPIQTAMKLLVTGANGFLGNYVVNEAVARGHSVRALVRPGADLLKTSWGTNENVEVVRADLTRDEGLADALARIECVIHLAAAKTGDAETQFEGTVRGTEKLLNAMDQFVLCVRLHPRPSEFAFG